MDSYQADQESQAGGALAGAQHATADERVRTLEQLEAKLAELGADLDRIEQEMQDDLAESQADQAERNRLLERTRAANLTVSEATELANQAHELAARYLARAERAREHEQALATHKGLRDRYAVVAASDPLTPPTADPASTERSALL